MRSFAAAFLMCAALVGCERSRPEVPTCDLDETRISDSTLGPLYIGEALASLRVRCPAVGDTAVATYGSPAAVGAQRLTVRGAPVIIRNDGSRVTALHVESPVFRTADSIGVGASVSVFRNVAGIRVSKSPVTSVPVLLDRRRCGVAYDLSGWGGDTVPADTTPVVRGNALASWPDSVVVRGVTVSGCRGNTSDLGVDSLSEGIPDSVAAHIDSLMGGDSAAIPTPSVTPAQPSRAPLPASAATPAAPTTTTAITATTSELSALRGKLDVPVQGVSRSQLRDTYAESRSSGRLHEAIDIPAPRGTPVIAAADGRLLKLFNSKAGGLMVYAADPSDRFILLYGHLDRYADGLTEGMPLRRGQVIGYVGTTGNAPPGTPHLHFAVLRGNPGAAWWRGTAVNPYPLLSP